MVMEAPDGKIAVELFKDPDSARLAFDSLSGKPIDLPSRATFVEFDWREGFVSSVVSKNLPVIKNPDDEPYGHELGVGPIPEPEKVD